ncbi:MAG: FlgD immunoglobulin-like domain containing protein [Chitinivibrionales bacterium]
MKHSIFRGLFRGLQICMACCALSFANPIPPLPPLSEIQVIDPLHWTVEVDCKKNQFSIVQGPCSTDTFTLYCGQQNTAPLIDSMQKCAMPEVFDSNNIALLTPQQFPKLKILKGWYVFLGLKDRSGYFWTAQIPLTLSPTSSIISGYYTYLCGVEGGIPDYCTDIKYDTSSCPSLGTPNDSAFGSITGQVLGSDSLALKGIRVNCSNRAFLAITAVTNASGMYTIAKLDSCHVYYINFTDSSGVLLSNPQIGPLRVSIGHARIYNIQLNYKIPTSLLVPRQIQKIYNKIRFLQTANWQRIVLSVLESSLGKGTVEIFSTNGKCIRTLRVDFNESGTYTIAWDGCNDRHAPVAPGKYGCRVQLNGETACSGFIIK